MVLAINYYGFLFRVGDSDDWGGKKPTFLYIVP